MDDQHFPKGFLLHQIFDRWTLKAAYHTGKNFKQIIDAYNKNIFYVKAKKKTQLLGAIVDPAAQFKAIANQKYC